MTQFQVNDIVTTNFGGTVARKRKWLIESISGQAAYVVSPNEMDGGEIRSVFNVRDLCLEYRRKEPFTTSDLITKPLHVQWPGMEFDLPTPAYDGYFKTYGHLSKDGQVAIGFDGPVPKGMPSTIVIHTNEVQEDTSVNRVQYIEPNVEDLTAKIAECDRQIERTKAKSEKLANKHRESWEKLNELETERARLAFEQEENSLRRPKEPMRRFDRSTVITFVKKFGSGTNRSYEYAAIRPAGKTTWSVTGKAALTSATWAELVAFIEKDERTFSWKQRAFDSIRVRS